MAGKIRVSADAGMVHACSAKRPWLSEATVALMMAITRPLASSTIGGPLKPPVSSRLWISKTPCLVTGPHVSPVIVPSAGAP